MRSSGLRSSSFAAQRGRTGVLRASARALDISEKALSKSSGARASMICSHTHSARAEASASFSLASLARSGIESGFKRRAISGASNSCAPPVCLVRPQPCQVGRGEQIPALSPLPTEQNRAARSCSICPVLAGNVYQKGGASYIIRLPREPEMPTARLFRARGDCRSLIASTAQSTQSLAGGVPRRGIRQRGQALLAVIAGAVFRRAVRAGVRRPRRPISCSAMPTRYRSPPPDRHPFRQTDDFYVRAAAP